MECGVVKKIKCKVFGFVAVSSQETSAWTVLGLSYLNSHNCGYLPYLVVRVNT